MIESYQHKLDRVRPPRVQITYDVEIGGAIETRELPFVMGVLADLSGKPKEALPRLKDRKFVEIDPDNFNDVMISCQPRITMGVDNLITAKGKLMVELSFSSMDDFGPVNIINQVGSMKEVYDERVTMNDLIGKLDGNEALYNVLAEFPKEKAQAAKLAADGNLIKDPSQQESSVKLIEAFMALKAKEGDPVAVINQRIAEIDQLLSTQLDLILHDEEMKKLEGTWRGMHYLIRNSETGPRLKIRVLNVTKKELLDDLERAMEFDQSQMFKKVYEDEYGTFGGNPFSVLVADFEIGRHPNDLILMEELSHVAAAAHAPLIANASPAMFDLNSFTELGVPRDLSKIFNNTELAKWNTFRLSEDSRYVALTMPRILMRLPYGAKTVPVDNLGYEENVDGEDNSKFCWGSASFAMAVRYNDAAAKFGWTAAIRGVEGGGLVVGLPAYSFKSTDGDTVLKCPTEVAITDRREKELSDLGFLPILHSKGTDMAAFFGIQTAQKPKLYDLDTANANARLSARLSYILVTSRFAHYIKVIMRDKIGSFMSREDVSMFLNRWIAQYVLLSDNATQDTKARYPLREARIDVIDEPGKPGCYIATVFLRPHFQLEELKVSLRLVATLPAPASA